MVTRSRARPRLGARVMSGLKVLANNGSVVAVIDGVMGIEEADGLVTVEEVAMARVAIKWIHAVDKWRDRS